jgi:solute carrier family 25 protein 43
MAGFLATMCTYPLDTLKTRVTMEHVDPERRFNINVQQTTLRMYSEEGIASFFKGAVPTLLGIVPFVGGTFMAYEIAESMWNKPKDQFNSLDIFLSGCVAASIGQTVAYPFDTVRKKMQAQFANAPLQLQTDVEFRGMIDCFLQVIKKNGFRGLWRGNIANIIKVAPFSGVMFVTYESVKNLFVYKNGYTISPFQATPRAKVSQEMNPAELRKWLVENKDKVNF